jgi:hypothetical protein
VNKNGIDFNLASFNIAQLQVVYILNPSLPVQPHTSPLSSPVFPSTCILLPGASDWERQHRQTGGPSELHDSASKLGEDHRGSSPSGELLDS